MPAHLQTHRRLCAACTCARGEAAERPQRPSTSSWSPLSHRSLFPHFFYSELISNASDALEKLRHRQVGGEPCIEPSAPLQISVETNEAENTISISDSGIGMDRQELMDNLGTIARSGSRAFMQRLREGGGGGGGGSGGGGDAGAAIIGQFGVGFYSSFMVAEHVTVLSRAATPGSRALRWTSAGDGEYEISEVPEAAPAAETVARGSRIVLKLRDSCRDFSRAASVKEIVTRYSNFVGFPIMLNGSRANTVQAIWASSKADVTEEAYVDFYKFKSGDFEAPLLKLHFSSDAPTSIKALLFVGQSHDEKYGMGRMKPGVDLYSRKVLIQSASAAILPDWLRFVHGVVDSEDIPLNISRESMQDSALMRRIKAVLTRRVIRFLDAEARKDAKLFNERFFPEFGAFLKEGCITDTSYSQDLAKLLRFESSALPAGQLTSLDEYLARTPVGQQSIYYLVAPHRGIAEASPYMEAFKGKRAAAAAGDTPAGAEGVGDVEVLFLYSPIDDFVMNNLREFSGRKLLTAETAELDPELLQGIKKPAAAATAAAAAAAASPAAAASGAAPTAAEARGAALSEAEVGELSAWMLRVLPSRLAKVRATQRLRASPCVVTDHESASLRRMMRMVEAGAAGGAGGGGGGGGSGSGSGGDSQSLRLEQHMLPRQTLEINPAHAVIMRLHAIRESQPDLARAVAEQLVDNALIAAGLVDDSRTMLPRLSGLLERVLGVNVEKPIPSASEVEAKRFTGEREASERAAINFGSEVASDIGSRH